MENFKRIRGFEHLSLEERLLYKALNDECSELSVSSSWKHYGIIQQELNSMYFRERLLTDTEYDILDAYLLNVIYADCYWNMMNRMKVRDKDER